MLKRRDASAIASVKYEARVSDKSGVLDIGIVSSSAENALGIASEFRSVPARHSAQALLVEAALYGLLMNEFKIAPDACIGAPGTNTVAQRHRRQGMGRARLRGIASRRDSRPSGQAGVLQGSTRSHVDGGDPTRSQTISGVETACSEWATDRTSVPCLEGRARSKRAGRIGHHNNYDQRISRQYHATTCRSGNDNGIRGRPRRQQPADCRGYWYFSTEHGLRESSPRWIHLQCVWGINDRQRRWHCYQCIGRVLSRFTVDTGHRSLVR